MKPILSSGYKAGQHLPNRSTYSINVIILKICTTSICSFVTKCLENPDRTLGLGVILVSSELMKSLVTEGSPQHSRQASWDQIQLLGKILILGIAGLLHTIEI